MGRLLNQNWSCHSAGRSPRSSGFFFHGRPSWQVSSWSIFRKPNIYIYNPYVIPYNPVGIFHISNTTVFIFTWFQGFSYPKKRLIFQLFTTILESDLANFYHFFFGCIDCIETYQNRLWNNYNLYYIYIHIIYIYILYIYTYIHIVEKTYSSISLQNHEAVGSRPSRPGRPRLRNSWRRSALAAVSWWKSMGNSLVEWIRKTKVFFFFQVLKMSQFFTSRAIIEDISSPVTSIQRNPNSTIKPSGND